jgi:hypothetical protein
MKIFCFRNLRIFKKWLKVFLMHVSYELNQFTKSNLAATKSRWQSVAGKDEFASEYTVLFDWVNTHKDYSALKADSLAYGLFAPKSRYASAIVDVVSSKKGKRGITKLLKVYVTPELWDVTTHQSQIIDIFAGAIFGTIDLSVKISSDTVKLYGRSDELLSLLHSLHIHLNRSPKLMSTTVTMQGRWLQIATS